MAYSKENYYKKILDVQTMYLQHKNEYTTNQHIFKTFIEPYFRISRTTMYNYLRTNAKAELKKLNNFL